MTNVKLENEFGDENFGLFANLKVGNDSTCIGITLKNEIKGEFFQPAVMMVDISGTSIDPLCQAVKDTPEIQKFTQNDIYTRDCDANGENCKKSWQGQRYIDRFINFCLLKHKIV